MYTSKDTESTALAKSRFLEYGFYVYCIQFSTAYYESMAVRKLAVFDSEYILLPLFVRAFESSPDYYC